MTRRDRLGLTVITGFLGSGKTTLLRRALGDCRPDVAVVMNEFAEEGVDQVLIGQACARVVTISGGCACCERREELLQALRHILDDYERGRLAGLRHVMIETSGLADPLPIVTAVALDPVLRHHFELGVVVTVVDGQLGAAQLDCHPEARRQALSADRIFVSKTDLAEPALVKALEVKLAGLAAFPDESVHTDKVTSASITFDRPLDWVAFGVWLSLLVHAHGPRLLRIKGVVPAAGLGAIAVNGVGHALYPPEHIEAPAILGRLVVIAQDLSAESITRSLLAFQHAA